MTGRPAFGLLISDVDGTLVTPEKELTPEAISAVRALRTAGIRFAVTSSRPPRGLGMLVAPLELDTPLCGFNGGLIADPSFRPLESAPLDRAVVRETLGFLAERKLDTWLFDAENWYLRDPDGPYVARERHTIGFGPSPVDDLDGLAGPAFKIVGVSQDFDLLARCEGELRDRLGARATVARSQPYFLDVTDRRANKGRVVQVLADRLGVHRDRIAVIGDGPNDVAMFAAAGFSVAMGNAAAETRAAASAVTGTNTLNGFADAVRRYILAPQQSEEAAQ